VFSDDVENGYQNFKAEFYNSRVQHHYFRSIEKKSKYRSIVIITDYDIPTEGFVYSVTGEMFLLKPNLFSNYRDAINCYLKENQVKSVCKPFMEDREFTDSFIFPILSTDDKPVSEAIFNFPLKSNKLRIKFKAFNSKDELEEVFERESIAFAQTIKLKDKKYSYPQHIYTSSEKNQSYSLNYFLNSFAKVTSDIISFNSYFAVNRYNLKREELSIDRDPLNNIEGSYCNIKLLNSHFVSAVCFETECGAINCSTSYNSHNVFYKRNNFFKNISIQHILTKVGIDNLVKKITTGLNQINQIERASVVSENEVRDGLLNGSIGFSLDYETLWILFSQGTYLPRIAGEYEFNYKLNSFQKEEKSKMLNRIMRDFKK
jgi:hypothetical protein